MRITVLTLLTFIVGAIIGGFYGDALGIRNATESRTVETLEATVATQKKTLATKDATLAELRKQLGTKDAIAVELEKQTKFADATAAALKKRLETQDALIAAQRDTIAVLQVRVREADPPAIPFEFEAPE